MGVCERPAASPNSERNLRKRFLVDPSGKLSLNAGQSETNLFAGSCVGQSLRDRHFISRSEMTTFSERLVYVTSGAHTPALNIH
jgi:hypothetical protein